VDWELRGCWVSLELSRFWIELTLAGLSRLGLLCSSRSGFGGLGIKGLLGLPGIEPVLDRAHPRGFESSRTVVLLRVRPG